MINLKLQIYSIIYTFIYGGFCALLVNLFYKILFYRKYYFKLISNFLFVIIMTILYFFILKIINYGYIHIYFLLVFSLGFFMFFSFFKRKLRK